VICHYSFDLHSSNTVSPPHRNRGIVTFQRDKHPFTSPITWVSSHVWHTLPEACTLYEWLCSCELYSTVCSSTESLFQAQMSGSKHQSSGDVAGTTVLFKALCCRIKCLSFCLCIICVESIINLLHYSSYTADRVSWLPNFIGLKNMLSEWNLFICRGLL